MGRNVFFFGFCVFLILVGFGFCFLIWFLDWVFFLLFSLVEHFGGSQALELLREQGLLRHNPVWYQVVGISNLITSILFHGGGLAYPCNSGPSNTRSDIATIADSQKRAGSLVSTGYSHSRNSKQTGLYNTYNEDLLKKPKQK